MTLRTALIAAAAMILSAGAGLAQTTIAPPATTGPYGVISAASQEVALLAVGSRTRSGGIANVTLITLFEKASGADIARIDMGMEINCVRRTSMQTVIATRKLDHTLISSQNSANRVKIEVGTRPQDNKIIALACDGTLDGATTPNLEGFARQWRAGKAAANPSTE